VWKPSTSITGVVHVREIATLYQADLTGTWIAPRLSQSHPLAPPLYIRLYDG
jgi:hypothetical protein